MHTHTTHTPPGDAAALAAAPALERCGHAAGLRSNQLPRVEVIASEFLREGTSNSLFTRERRTTTTGAPRVFKSPRRDLSGRVNRSLIDDQAIGSGHDQEDDVDDDDAGSLKDFIVDDEDEEMNIWLL